MAAQGSRRKIYPRFRFDSWIPAAFMAMPVFRWAVEAGQLASGFSTGPEVSRFDSWRQSVFMKTELIKDRLITVCEECLRACCWQGEFMCDDARDADITEKPVSELMALGLESSHYWEND